MAEKEEKKKKEIVEEAKPVREKFSNGIKEAEKEKISFEALEKALGECEKLRDEYLEGWKRAKADFFNYKKEETERMEVMADFVRASLILKILEISDDFERAKKEIPKDFENSEWVRGIVQTESKIKKILDEEEVKEIAAGGKKFDPNFHEATEEINLNGKESGTIVEVLQKGYLFKGQLLRPAKVKIAK